ncbi:tpaE [Nocardiopsis suaedae]|uniref:TpaE n=1 Tax=Nocardiopsis suaedae TaxID=3018444 RepID=A0ABT4TJ13_9ACTN|nr:tpaE [Nocardiopsis suaedae]MDA2804667.1 tpaE [Nocardiopsis suaedae]
MVSEFRAETVGRAARGGDLQLTVPRRPVMRRGVRLRRTGAEVVLDGADRSQRFRGAFAADHLLPLAEACDGGRGHGEIAERLGLSEPAVYKALALLWAAGAVEEAPDREPPETAPEFACLLSRLGNSTGANRSWTEGAERLARGVVLLAGDDAFVGAAARAFGGTCTVRTGGAAPRARDGVRMVVFFETAASHGERAAEAERCWEEGVPFLRVRADGESVTVGPYTDPALTPCAECATAHERGAGGAPPGHAVDLAAGLAAHHVLALLSRATVTHLPMDTVEIGLEGLSTRYAPGATRPGCPVCSHSRGPMAAGAPSSALYEASVAMPPRSYLDPKGHLGHFQSQNMSLPSEFRTWPSNPKTELPPPRLERLRGGGGPPPARAGAPTLDDLSLLLKAAFGVQERPEGEGSAAGTQVRRWTAAAGNIGCTTGYVLCRDPDLLPVGVYAYVERDHRLARIGTRVPPGPAPADLVVTGDLAKVMRKYGTFGFRLTMLDAGCNLASAREAAERIGVALRPLPDWDDALLCDHLGTSLTGEPVVAAVELGGTRED